MNTTFQGSWELLAEVTAGDPLGTYRHRMLDGTTTGYTYAYSDKSPYARQIPPEANWVEIVFIGDMSGGFAYALWGYATNGFAERICDGTVMVDATATDAGTPRHEFPYKDITPGEITDTRFADIVTVNSRHVNTVTVANSGGTNTGPAKIVFDVAGLRWLYMGISDLSGHITDCTAMWSLYRYF